MRVAVERKVTEERARIIRVGVQLGAQNTLFAVNAQIDLRRCHHAEHWRNKVEPYRSPHIGEYGRAGRSCGVNTEARNRREDKYVERNQNSDKIARVLSERRSIREPKHDQHEERGHKILRAKCTGCSAPSRNRNRIVHRGNGQAAAQAKR